MTRKVSFLIALIVGLYMTGFSQDGTLAINSKPKDMWEVGINVGHSIVTGDVDWDSSFGVGLHLRKSLDYIFSIRLDGAFHAPRGTEDEDRRLQDGNNYGFSNWTPEYKTTFIGGDITMVASLNQLKIGKTNKINPYFFAGAGVSSVTVTAIDGDTEKDVEEELNPDDPWGTSPYLTGGAGLSFRIGKKASLGLEHKIMAVMGRADDLLDAAELHAIRAETSSRDLLNYTNLRLSIALGKEEDKSLPLWWASPLDMVAEDLAEVKARPIFDTTDTDGDGIVDMFDQETSTPSGAPVDTRGVALDSDGDGVADYEDKEPYSPPGYKVDNNGVADIPPVDMLTEDDVNKIVDAKLKNFKVPTPAAPRMDWFLPMVNFDNNRYSIKGTEYGKLHQIATVMQQHPGLRVVASGYTDATAGNCYNDVLSYNRAQASIDYIVSKYGVRRDRFVLNYGGENKLLNPTQGKSLANRRVEFKVATVESEMGRPDCGVSNAGSGGSGYSGNKESGY